MADSARRSNRNSLLIRITIAAGFLILLLGISHQSLMDRILGVGSIHVVSRDHTLPELTIRGIPHPRPLFETLKQRVIAVKRSRGVIKVDPV